VRVSGLTVSEAKLALETHVTGAANAPTQASGRSSELPSPALVATGFVPAGPSLCAKANDQADAGPRPPEVNIVQARTVAPHDPVTAPIEPGREPTGVRPAGIDRMIGEHTKLAQRRGPRSNDRAASVQHVAGMRTNHYDQTISAASYSAAGRPLTQVSTSPYHALGAMPVFQASYNGPDPFPTEVASSPSDLGPHDAKPDIGSQPKSGWQRLCDSVRSIRLPNSSATDVP
jgi:hypothetical protein